MKRGSSDAAAAWPDCDAWRPKSLFEVYYKLQRVVERHKDLNEPRGLRHCLRRRRAGLGHERVLRRLLEYEVNHYDWERLM